MKKESKLFKSAKWHHSHIMVIRAISSLLIIANVTQSQTLFGSRAFRSSKEVGIKANNDELHENELLVAIQNEIDSLYLNFSQTSCDDETDSDGRQYWSRMLGNFTNVLTDAMNQSFRNITRIKSELSSYLLEELRMSDENEEEGLSEVDGINFALSNNNSERFNVDDKQRAAIEEAVETIKGSKSKAEQMVAKALDAMSEVKQHAVDTAENRITIERSHFHKILDEFRATKSPNRYRNVLYGEEKEADDGTLSKFLFRDDTWMNAGYTHFDSKTDIHNTSLMSLFQVLPLKKYNLLNDSKKDILVSKTNYGDEMKTRTHIGLLDTDFTIGFIDPELMHEGEVETNLISFLNLKVLSEIADEIDDLQSKLDALDQYTTNTSILSFLIKSLGETIHSPEKYESLSDLAVRVAAVEAEMVTKNITLLLQTIKKDLRIRREYARMDKLISILNAEVMSDYTTKKGLIQRKGAIQQLRLHREASLDSVIEVLNLINKISSTANITEREMIKLYRYEEDNALSEIAIIFADAEEERKDEATAIESIRLLGEESRIAIVQMVEIIFGHIVHGFVYLLTEGEGRNQALMIAVAASILVFSISICNELIIIAFNTIIRMISKPRLVREWGNIVWTCRPRTKISDVIISKEERERVAELCRSIDKGTSRRAPSRNILVYGQTGTGKSMIARAIAESAKSMPYAVMSGADIAPLKHLGPSELRNVLTWANRQRNGGIIIIDEAESALGRRVREQKLPQLDRKNENVLSTARDALNVFLTLTGDTDGKAMIILTTSNPGSLDEAVLDRCDEMIHCRSPTEIERMEILTKEMRRRFFLETVDYTVPNDDVKRGGSFQIKSHTRKCFALDPSFNVAVALNHLSKDEQTMGFSGRELCKIIRAVESALYSSEDCILTFDLWNRVVNDASSSIRGKKTLRSKRIKK